MSRFQGGMIGSVANATSGTAYTGRANGVFPLPQQIVAKSSSLWAIGQTRPNPPTIGTATGTGATTISVAFIPPVQNGGSTITSYTVTSSGGQTATGSSSPIVVSGLTSTTYYTFTVTATNALGTSDSSGTSNSVQPAIPDPYFSSVSLLLNGDTLTDLSSNPKSITNNSVSIDTSTKQYGTGSMYMTGGQYLTIPYSTGFNFPGDFTIEFWARPNTQSGAGASVFGNYSSWGSGSGALQIFAKHSPGQKWLIAFNGAFPFITGPDIIVGSWSHIALVRSGSTFTLYVNGVASGTNTSSQTVSGTSDNIRIGTASDEVGGGYNYSGYLDDYRVTKGVARYTTNFTPPTAAFPTL